MKRITLLTLLAITVLLSGCYKRVSYSEFVEHLCQDEKLKGGIDPRLVYAGEKQGYHRFSFRHSMFASERYAVPVSEIDINGQLSAGDRSRAVGRVGRFHARWKNERLSRWEMYKDAYAALAVDPRNATLASLPLNWPRPDVTLKATTYKEWVASLKLVGLPWYIGTQGGYHYFSVDFKVTRISESIVSVPKPLPLSADGSKWRLIYVSGDDWFSDGIKDQL